MVCGIDREREMGFELPSSSSALLSSWGTFPFLQHHLCAIIFRTRPWHQSELVATITGIFALWERQLIANWVLMRIEPRQESFQSNLDEPHFHGFVLTGCHFTFSQTQSRWFLIVIPIIALFSSGPPHKHHSRLLPWFLWSMMGMHKLIMGIVPPSSPYNLIKNFILKKQQKKAASLQPTVQILNED